MEFNLEEFMIFLFAGALIQLLLTVLIRKLKTKYRFIDKLERQFDLTRDLYLGTMLYLGIALLFLIVSCMKTYNII